MLRKNRHVNAVMILLVCSNFDVLSAENSYALQLHSLVPDG